MYLSNTKRTFKLIGHLLSNPKNIIPYLGYSANAQSVGPWFRQNRRRARFGTRIRSPHDLCRFSVLISSVDLPLSRNRILCLASIVVEVG